jgi:glutamate dehydrogenase
MQPVIDDAPAITLHITKEADGHPGTLKRQGSITGYHQHQFVQKVQQMQKVAENIQSKGFIPPELVNNEVSWFYGYVDAWYL